MALTWEPRRVVALVVALGVVGLLGVQLVLAVGPVAQRSRFSACIALKPTASNPVFKAGFPAVAPEMTFPGQAANGADARLSAYRGQVVFLNFWAPWCAPCVEEMPDMEELNASLAGEAFTMLAVASEKDPAKVRGFFPKGTKMSVLLDPPVGDDTIGQRTRAWGTEKLPETYLIDKKGVVRYYFVNQREWNSPIARQCVQALLDE